LGDGDGPAIGPNKSGPSFIVTRQVTGQIRVEREGELVVLRLGTTIVRLKHADAIRVGHWLMSKGIEAKIQAGDRSLIAS